MASQEHAYETLSQRKKHVQRPSSAFAYFPGAKSYPIHSSIGDMKKTDLKAFSELTPAERQKYEKRAEQNMQRYLQEIKEIEKEIEMYERQQAARQKAARQQAVKKMYSRYSKAKR